MAVKWDHASDEFLLARIPDRVWNMILAGDEAYRIVKQLQEDFPIVGDLSSATNLYKRMKGILGVE